MKKRPLSLLEVMITLVLASILIALFFHAQSDMAIANAQVEKAKGVMTERSRFFMRMNQIFSNVKKFYTDEEKRLVLEYDNGVDFDPLFSGELSSLLYLEGKKLCLASWPEEGEGRNEILMDRVTDLSFQFFDEEKNDWIDLLPKASKKKARMVKIVVKIEKEQVEFPFFI